MRTYCNLLINRSFTAGTGDWFSIIAGNKSPKLMVNFPIIIFHADREFSGGKQEKKKKTTGFGEEQGFKFKQKVNRKTKIE